MATLSAARLLALLALSATMALSSGRQLQASCKTILKQYDQCGGLGGSSCAGSSCTDSNWAGFCCPTNFTCVRSNAYYWQCMPRTSSSTPTPPNSTPTKPPTATKPVTRRPFLVRYGKQCGGKGGLCAGALCRDKPWTGYACVTGTVCKRRTAQLWSCLAAPPKSSPPPLKTPAPKPAPPPTRAPPPTPGPMPAPSPTSSKGPHMKYPSNQAYQPNVKITLAGNGDYDYSVVLGLSQMFFEAQRSGELPADNRVWWRGDSFLNDQGPSGQDLTGGWFDAGDLVKFNFPMAFTATMVAWGLLEFPRGYEKSGQTSAAMDNVKWVASYLIKCHISENEFVAQVGNGHLDHARWSRPEDIRAKNPVYVLDAKNPGSDLAGGAAATLASTAMLFRKTDPNFSKLCLLHAQQIYKFGKTYLGKYSDSVEDAAAFYKSNNMYDDLAWGAMWLFHATGEVTYALEAKEHFAKYWNKENGAGQWNNFDWDSAAWGATVLLDRAFPTDSMYSNKLNQFTNAWLTGSNGPTFQPSGYAWNGDWGSLRRTGNAVALMMIYGKSLPVNMQEKITCFAHTQIRFMLGSSGHSYVVGYGPNPPKRPHHRGASCPLNPNVPCTWDALSNAGPNPHILYGALVGGPDGDAKYTDDRNNFISNEVTTDYNAGFTSALASLVSPLVTYKQCQQMGLVS